MTRPRLPAVTPFRAAGLAALAAGLAACAASGVSGTHGAGSANGGTHVVTYQPWAAPGRLVSGISAGPAQSGSCFSTSSATTAPGAYRCTVGNLLYDPCFADATSAEVACPVPDKPASAVVIRLTSPLPRPATSPGSPVIPFLLVLANGQRCETITGTGGVLGGKDEAYGCPRGGVYGLPDEKGSTWTVSYAPAGAPASAMVPVKVTTAYE